MQRIVILILLGLLPGFSFCQQQIANPGKATKGSSIIHAGQIFFTDRFISIDSIRPADFLKSYTLTHKSDLFFIARFDKPLTTYKQQLAPGLPVDSLFKTGNYQFTLFVDGKEIYRSELLPGAPNARIQDAALELNRPLIDNKNGQGSWSESFWNRFLLNGGEKALTEGMHQLRMEIRPYVKRGKLVTGEIMAEGECQVNVKRNIHVDISTIQLNRVLPTDGFPVSYEWFDRSLIKKLKGNINEGVFKKINSIIVIKKGALLLEEYFNGAQRNSLHDSRSVGKSFASTMVGLAIKDGLLKNVDQPLRDFYPLDSFKHFTPAKAAITLRDLLTMGSAFAGNDDDGGSPGNEENMYPTADWVKFTLDLPAEKKPPGQWQYFTAGVILLGDIVNKSVKEGLQTYADERLFKPVGIRDYKWEYTPTKVPNTAGGIRLKAIDLAKYGQLYKNGGTWKEHQLIPANWVSESFQQHRKIPSRDNEYYGYLFWNKTFMAGERRYEAWYCAGNGGNYVLIFKDQPLVVVITASAYGQPYAHRQVTEILQGYILPAVADGRK